MKIAVKYYISILTLIGIALAPIFPLTIWLTPQRIPTAIVPAAIGFITSVSSLGAAMIPLALLMAVLHQWMVKN